MYINPIITSLKGSSLGCHMRHLFVGCVLYADDILLISASVKSLQNTLDVCNSVANNIGIAFNPLKSKCIYIGPDLHIEPATMNVGSANLEWSNQITYLGIKICHAKNFQVDLSDVRRKFFSSEILFYLDVLTLQIW